MKKFFDIFRSGLFHLVAFCGLGIFYDFYIFFLLIYVNVYDTVNGIAVLVKISSLILYKCYIGEQL